MFSALFFWSPIIQVTLSSLPEQRAASLQQRALSLLTDGQSSFVDGLVNIYQLGSVDPAALRLHVMRLQTLNCYKEASLPRAEWMPSGKVFGLDL